VSGDVGRIAFQTDTGQYWRLTAITPTWQLIGPPTTVPPPVYASLQTPPVSPTNTTSTTGAMMGLGVGHTLTPTATGKVFVAFDGTLTNAIASKTSNAQIRYGTGTPPANGAATSGTAVGGIGAANGNAAVEVCPFSAKAVLTGLVIGTPIWFDLCLWTDSGGGAVILQTTTTAIELP
jgi:hypothetical protein